MKRKKSKEQPPESKPSWKQLFFDFFQNTVLMGYTPLSDLFKRWIETKQLLLAFLAVLVGIITAIGATVFIFLLKQFQKLSLLFQQNMGQTLGLLLSMALAGLLVGLLIHFVAEETKGAGIPQVIKAVAAFGGFIRKRVFATKIVTSSLTIGFGGSAGREGPIVHIGATAGSVIGQWFHISKQRIQILVACGAAAGISASFQAPIAGTIFALEVVLANFSTSHFGIVVISSVTSSIVSKMIFGLQSPVVVPTYSFQHIEELFFYFLLAILATLVSVVFVYSLAISEELFKKWKTSIYIKTTLGMILTGMTALLFSKFEILGSGLPTIEKALSHSFEFSMGLLLLLFALKFIATLFTLSSGNSGGFFAPTLFMGAMLGGMVGLMAKAAYPHLSIHPGAYAIVGMAAVFSSAARAPMTAILIIFEMSNNYQLILPLMLVTVLSTLLSEAFLPESVYKMSLKREGIELREGKDTSVLQSVTCEQIMEGDFHSISSDTTIEQAFRILEFTHRHGLVVLDYNGELYGVVTVFDIEKSMALKVPLGSNVSEIATPYHKLQLVYLDESIGQALEKMGIRGFSFMPVVSKDSPKIVEGVLEEKDILGAYSIVSTKKKKIEIKTKKKERQEGTEYIDVILAKSDNATGKKLRDVGPLMPQDSIIVSVKRGEQVLIPHGNLQFREGDLISVFAHTHCIKKIFKALKHS